MARSLKALMMPSTVPKSPMKGALFPRVLSTMSRRSSSWRSRNHRAAITSSTVAAPTVKFRRPSSTTRASTAVLAWARAQ